MKLKIIVLGWAIEHYKENDKEPSLEDIEPYRQDEDKFRFWADYFFKVGYGAVHYRNLHTQYVVSEILSVYDEAFVVAAIYNGFERWSKEASLLATNVQITKSTSLPKGKWTETGPNSKKYEGWMEEGIVFFNERVADIKAVRLTSNAIKIEKSYLQEKKNGKEKKKDDASSTRSYSTSAVNGLDTDDEQEGGLFRSDNNKRARTASTARGGSKQRRVSLDNLSDIPNRNRPRNSRDEEHDVDEDSESGRSSSDENEGSYQDDTETDSGFYFERRYSHDHVGQRDQV